MLKLIQLALLPFSQRSAPVVRHQTNGFGCVGLSNLNVVEVRYRTVWSGISSHWLIHSSSATSSVVLPSNRG